MNPIVLTSTVDLAREPDFRLGELEIRPSRREMVSGEDRAIIEPRVMQLLVALARRRGEVVSREELIGGCWQGRIVGDDAINACVSKARRAGAATGAYEIETIPRVGYRMLADAGAPDAHPIAAPNDDVRLAVLPFENLSDDPQLKFFSDGVSEEILHALAQRAGLSVIGRSSSFQFRGADKAVANVARRLNVTHVLDGAVRRDGDRTRISAQLIDCATETAVWADRFEGERSAIFALQDKVAGAVAQAMRCALAPAVRSGAVDPLAYDLYLRGNIPPNEMSSGYQAQIALLEEAVERAPGFADAWASLGCLRAHRAYIVSAPEARAARAAARSAARHALTLDPRCGLAAAAMARAGPDHGEGLNVVDAWLQKALDWAPDNAVATFMQARFLSGVGRRREGLALIRRAHNLDPLNLHITAMVGRTLCENGELEKAAAVLEDVRDRWDEFQLLRLWMIVILGRQGKIERARSLLAEQSLGPYERDITAFFDNHVDPAPGVSSRAIADLRIQKSRGRVSIDAFCAAALLGHLDEAFELAAQSDLGLTTEFPAVSSGAYNLSLLFTDLTAPIRLDPRFVGLCDRLGLVAYWQATDAWPDCVEETDASYDFKAECHRVAAGRKLEPSLSVS